LDNIDLEQMADLWISPEYRDYYMGYRMNDQFSSWLYETKNIRRIGVILNTDDSDESGEHWVACYKPSKNTLLYFDPLSGIISTQVGRALEKNKIKPTVVSNFVQPIFSKMCGYYSMIWLSDMINQNISNVKDGEKSLLFTLWRKRKSQTGDTEYKVLRDEIMNR